MQRVTIDVEFVTPGFVGAADPTGSVEWSAKSIRGQLRWWFRAVAARHYGFDVKALRESEEEIWGSTTRKSAVDVITEPIPTTSIAPPGQRFMNTVIPSEGTGKNSKNGPVYLGYGLFNVDGPPGTTKRPFIKPGTVATFQLIRRGKFTEHEINAIASWLFLGGIGSRSRRGYGSMRLVKAEGLEVTFDPTAVLGRARERKPLTAENLAQLPQLTCGSAFTRIYEWKTSFGDANGVDGWRRALHAAGKAMIEFRRRYKQTNPPTLDYEWAYMQATTAAGGTQQGNELQLPHRVGFGLPLPFGKMLILQGADHDRRASPLLIHIALETTGGKVQYRPRLTFMPGKFLPDREEVAFCRRQNDNTYPRGKSFPIAFAQVRIVQDFLQQNEVDGLTKEIL